MHEKKFNDSKSNNKNVPILDLSKSKHNKLEINKPIQDIKSNQIDENNVLSNENTYIKKIKKIITLIKFINQ